MMLIGGVTIFYFVTKAAGGVTAVSQLTQMPDKQFLFDLTEAFRLRFCSESRYPDH